MDASLNGLWNSTGSYGLSYKVGIFVETNSVWNKAGAQ